MHSDLFSRLPKDAAELSGSTSLGSTQHVVLTANVLIAFLQQGKVLSCPENPILRFRWYSILPNQASIDQLTEPDPSLLYVCRKDDAPSLLELHKTLFVLVLSDDESTPSWVQQYRNRMVLAAPNEGFYHGCALVQYLFSSMLAWLDKLDRSVIQRDSLAELLREGADLLNANLYVTDTWHNLIACHEEEQLAASMHDLVKLGCHTLDARSHLNDLLENAVHGEIIVDEERTCSDAVCLHTPICINSTLYYILSASCAANVPVRCAADLFGLLSERVSRLCAAFLEDNLRIEAPWHKALSSLISSNGLDAANAHEQLGKTKLAQATQLKLLCLDLDAGASPALRARVTAASTQLNSGRCYPFAYDGMLLALCYLTTDSDSHFSSWRTYDDYEAVIFDRFKVRAGASRIFTSLSELGLAYQQARLALNFAHLQDAERDLACLEPKQACYDFVFLMPYHRIVESCRTSRLSLFSVQRNVLEKLALDDREQGSNIVQLLWCYLCNNCNASAVSKVLNMHRNSVLYHIDKLKNRFDVDLSDFFTRSKLITDFRLYFLTEGFTHPIDHQCLLTIDKKHERPL